MKAAQRIAIVASFSGEGGVERMLINLLHGFVDIGVDIDLLRIRADGPFAMQVPVAINTIDLPTSHALTSIGPLFCYLRKNQPQAVLAVKDRAGRAVLLARLLSRTHPRVVVRLGTNLSASLQDRNLMDRWLRCVPQRMLYPMSDAVIAVSRGVAQDTIRLTGLPVEKVHVVPNPVISPSLLEMAREVPEHPWLTGKTTPVILAAGRLTVQKDFPTLIQAIDIVYHQTPVRLIILGEGRERSNLEQLIRERGLEEVVDLPGFVANPYAYMSSSELFVLSSAWEGSPNVLTEALALGLPVVATDCPSGPREVLQDGMVGPLVPVGDVDKLSQAILEVLGKTKNPEELKRAVSDYTAKNSARGYLQVLAPDG